MKLLGLYKWIIGTMSDFTKQFQDNDTLYRQAKAFWSNLESYSIFFVLLFILGGIGIAWFYYKPFNNQAGRHYKPKYWWIWGAVTFALSLLVTSVFEYLILPPKVDGSFVLELKIAVANAIYSSLVYVLISWIWCQFNISTNAYRYLKF